MGTPIRAVVFDLDGTLADTLRDLADATNRALTEEGFPPHPIAAYRWMVGNGVKKLAERALGDRSDPATVERVLARFRVHYDRDCLAHTVPYPGMVETLSALGDRGILLLVVTNKPQPQAEKIVGHLFGPRFAGVYGNLPGRAPKPDPHTVLEALEAAGVPPRSALFVGDSDVDVQTAKAAGMRCIGAVWGFRGAQELSRAEADALADMPRDLLRLCAEM